MSKNEAKEALVTVESRTVVTSITEADRKFILALVVIIAYILMLIIPILKSNVDLFKDVAATTSGIVGTIIGYYFGTKKE
jgi:multisubunit Na+/H+ antiporter MnhE subunit